MKMTVLVESVSKTKIPEHDKYLILEACVDDEEGEEVEIPYIRFKYRE